MNKLTKIAILSISLLTVMTCSAVSPALSNISNAFPNASINAIKLIVTLPALITIPVSLSSDKLTKWINKKQILMLGILIYLIGGLGAAFSNSIEVILINRATIGVGLGLIMPLAQSLIGDFYTGNERMKLTGYANAIGNLGGIIANVLVGILASISWRYSFSVYALGLLVIILNIIGLPDKKESIVSKKMQGKLNIKVIYLAIGIFLVSVIFFIIPTNLSLFIANENLGGSEFSGIAMGIFTFAGFAAGMVLAQLIKKLRKYTTSFAVATMTLGFGLLYCSHNVLLIVISVFLVGFGVGIIIPLIILTASNVCDEGTNNFSLSVITSSMFFGQFLSPFVVQFIGNILGNTTIRFSFGFLSIILLILLIIILVFNLNTGRLIFGNKQMRK